MVNLSLFKRTFFFWKKFYSILWQLFSLTKQNDEFFNWRHLIKNMQSGNIFFLHEMNFYLHNTEIFFSGLEFHQSIKKRDEEKTETKLAKTFNCSNMSLNDCSFRLMIFDETCFVSHANKTMFCCCFCRSGVFFLHTWINFVKRLYKCHFRIRKMFFFVFLLFSTFQLYWLQCLQIFTFHFCHKLIKFAVWYS